MIEQFEGLTDTLEILRPSEWAERKRYLPPSVTGMPGPYDFDVAPYIREIVDCLSIDSPVRELAVKKGVQLGLTVGVLENAIGYFIEHVKTAPVMLLTADAELAKLRVDSYITPMLQHSELEHLIKSSDERNARKTGKTDKKIEWVGGGFLVPFGAKNADKLRSLSIMVLLRDEIDAFADSVGKDGDPLKLSADRTAAFESSRKIADISTPLQKGYSKIDRRFARGDQRYYYVRCLSCGFPQVLRWTGTNKETGHVYGIQWETEGGLLVPGSVRYLCQNCGHEHVNDDKTRLLSPDHGAEWRPTAKPIAPDVRSYAINALYSPVGMQTWETSVLSWLEAWDAEHNRPRDMGLLQVFYNNVLGDSFEVRGDKVRFAVVSAHRRPEYKYGQVPNRYATEVAEGPVLVVTCAVDVHKDSLRVATFGWTRGSRAFLLDYWIFRSSESESDRPIDNLDDPETWGRLRELIEAYEYEADDGKRYRLALTLIDAGYSNDIVTTFASEYAAGVYPILGRESPNKNQSIKEFGEFTTQAGTVGYRITVDLYKDRWAAALRRSWDGSGIQPRGHFNAPIDTTDKQIKELTAEQKREKIEKTTGKRLGYEWYRPSGAANELWDLLVYNGAALDLIAWDVCRNQLDLEFVNWPGFWDLIEGERSYFS